MAQGGGRDGDQQRARTGPARRGFAAMKPEMQREIARKGGQASSRGQRRDAQGQFAGGRATGSAGSGGSSGGGVTGIGGADRTTTRGRSHERAADRDRTR